MTIQFPHRDEYPDFFQNYVGKIAEQDILLKLISQVDEMTAFFSAIPEEKRGFRYAPGKWNLHEVLGHLIDTERVFAYRALCIARQDPQILPPFEQDEYVRASHAASRPYAVLLAELLAVRQATILLFESFDTDMMASWGAVGNYRITVRALAYGIAGHIEHHFRLIKERYLP